MTTKRSIIFFWVLFLVPTLIMAGAAARLLSHEQDRINRSALLALTERADAIAQNIHLTVETVRDNLIQSLSQIQLNSLQQTLLDWEARNPLVRNVFVFTNDNTLTYPVKGMASTPEERRFMGRFNSVFSGRVPFDITDNGDIAEVARTIPVANAKKKVSRYARKELAALSKAPYPSHQAVVAQEQAGADTVFEPRSGWLPWFSENRLHVLVWVKTAVDGPIYGLELELVTLLSRLVVDFPILENEKVALVLMDGSGSYIHQAGGLDLTSTAVPAARVSVSNLLPHWQIGVFMGKKGSGSARGFFILSMILVGVFIAAIVSGGILLTRMALKTMKDAQQKTSFVSSVSHELKTPLTSIRMYAELLESGRVTDANKKTHYLSVIKTESERLTRLINNVLDFGKLEQGRKTYQKTQFEMDTFLYQVIEAHKIRIKSQGLEIITRVGEGNFRLCTDQDAIEQVVLNLLDNALKYAGDGKFFKFVLEKDPDGMILFKLCDDGPGIPKSQISMIFKKFHRIDNSLTAAQPGSGLGLSIAQKILRDLGGDLVYEQMEGNGSCFTARIKNHDSN